MEQSTAYREIKVTNHGLVTARDFRWEVEQSPQYEIIPLFEIAGDILPGETVIAPVLIVDKDFRNDPREVSRWQSAGMHRAGAWCGLAPPVWAG